MKKKVMIYVEESDWLEIRKRALDLGLSASRYLVSLHKKGGTVINPKIEVKEISSKDVEVFVEYTKAVDEAMPIPEKSKVIDEARQKINDMTNWRDSVQPIPKKVGKK